MSDETVALRHDLDVLRSDCGENYREHTRCLREMQRQIDDLSVTVFMLVGGFVVLLVIAAVTASEVFWR